MLLPFLGKFRIRILLANVTPVIERGQTTGYMSVRTKPSSEQVRGAVESVNNFGGGKLYAEPSGTGNFNVNVRAFRKEDIDDIVFDITMAVEKLLPAKSECVRNA